MAGQSEVGAKVSNSKSPPGGALWLVYKWEALRPLSEYYFASQSAGGGLFGTNEEAALRSRCRMIRYVDASQSTSSSTHLLQRKQESASKH